MYVCVGMAGLVLEADRGDAGMPVAWEAMVNAQCHCGRYMKRSHAVIGIRGGDEYIEDVRGDCSRCGPDQQAHREDWHWAWEAWKWESDERAEA